MAISAVGAGWGIKQRYYATRDVNERTAVLEVAVAGTFLVGQLKVA